MFSDVSGCAARRLGSVFLLAAISFFSLSFALGLPFLDCFAGVLSLPAKVILILGCCRCSSALILSPLKKIQTKVPTNRVPNTAQAPISSFLDKSSTAFNRSQAWAISFRDILTTLLDTARASTSNFRSKSLPDESSLCTSAASEPSRTPASPLEFLKGSFSVQIPLSSLRRPWFAGKAIAHATNLVRALIDSLVRICF